MANPALANGVAGCVRSWFCGATGSRSGEIVAALEPWATQAVAHPSGRPWLLGCWLPSDLLAFTYGSVRVVLLGNCLASRDEAAAEAERAVDTGDYDRLTRLPGNFHLAVSRPQGSIAYTDVAGLRRLFSAQHASTVVYASHARVLRELTGAEVDEEWLVSRLVAPALPHARGQRAPFRGLRSVPPGHRLTVHRDGAATMARYWSVPADTRPLVSSAPDLREQLTCAVYGRVSPVSQVTADLSGGLDSTSLTFLAVRSSGVTGASLCTLTFPPASPANDDLAFARAAAAAQPEAEHMFVDEDDYPVPYQDLADPPTLDEPASFAMSVARLRHVAHVLAGLGSGVHLSGAGGDAVLLAPLAYLWRAVRVSPRAALTRIRMHAALERRSMAAFLLELARPRSYRSWLAAAARGLDVAAEQPDLGLGWGSPPHAADWITNDALAAARCVLATAAGTQEPLAPDPGQHAAMERVLTVVGTARLYRDALATLGVAVEYPYCDRGVVETCLATRAHERTDPSRAKPLLAAALAGLVPAQVLARRTKGHYDTDLYLGLRRHRDALVALLDGSDLAGRGLVNADALRTAVHRLAAGQQGSLAQLNETLACELWLRTLAPSNPGARIDRGVV